MLYFTAESHDIDGPYYKILISEDYYELRGWTDLLGGTLSHANHSDTAYSLPSNWVFL